MPGHLPIRLLLSLLFAALVPAQTDGMDQALRVGDLVGLGGRPMSLLPLTGNWELSRARRWIRGELALFPRARPEQTLPSVPPSAWFDRNSLRDAVARLAQLGESELSCRDGTSLSAAPEHAEKCAKALTALRRSLPPLIQLRATLARTRGPEQVDLLSETVEVVPGCTRLMGNRRARRALVGYEAEIASGASILNPLVVDCVGGAMLAVRIRIAPRGDRAVADLLLRHVDDAPVEAIASGHPGCGAIDRLASHSFSCCAVIELTNGAACDLRWRRGANTELRLALQARWTPAPPQPDGDAVFYDSMAAPLPAFATALEPADEGGQAEDEKEDPGASGLDAFPTMTDHATGAWVVFGPDAQRARTLAQRWFDELPQPAVVDMRFLELPAGAPVPAADAPADATVLWAGELPVLFGRTGVVHDVRNQQFLADWDVEVAGQSRIPVPRLRLMQTGLVLDWRTDGTRIELAGEVSWHLGTEVHTGPLDMTVATASSLGNQMGTLPPVSLPQDVVAIEMPIVSRVPFAWRIPFDKDGAIVVRQAAPDRAGRELVLAARLRR